MISLLIVFIIFLQTVSVDCKPIFKTIMLGKHITHKHGMLPWTGIAYEIPFYQLLK